MIQKSNDRRNVYYDALDVQTASSGSFTGTIVELADTNVVFQVEGAATATENIVERSTVDPSNSVGLVPNWTAVGTPVTGDLTADGGVSAVAYLEPAHAWWRVSGTWSGGVMTTSISGKGLQTSSVG